MSTDFSDPRWAMFTPQQNNANRPQFGTRYLTDETAVFTQNAWDHVPKPRDQASTDAVATALARQHAAPVSDEDRTKFNTRPSNYWNNFYKQNDENFFRDRKWLLREFPALMLCALPDAGPRTILEIGCGAGNTVFPLLADNKNPDLRIVGCDYSAHAVKLVQRHPLYATPPCGSVHASVWDLSGDVLPETVEEGSVDVAVMVFVLSALHPDEWANAMRNVYRMLKPGGLVCVRDYGRHDLTQLRFKGGRLLDDNFYIRGDKTRVYFFELDELALMFTGHRATKEQKTVTTSTEAAGEVGDEPAQASKDVKKDQDQADQAEKKDKDNDDNKELQASGMGSAAPSTSSDVPTAPLDEVAPPPTMQTETLTAGSTSESMSPDHAILAKEVENLAIAESNAGTGASADVTTNTNKQEHNWHSYNPNDDSNVQNPNNPNGDEEEDEEPIIHPHLLELEKTKADEPAQYTIEQLHVDRRLLVNRKKQLKMYRVWMQGQFRKL